MSTPASAKVGSPVTLGSCDGDVSQWVFTLTGGLMVGLATKWMDVQTNGRSANGIRTKSGLIFSSN